VRVSSQHRLDAMAGNLGEISVIDTGNAQMRYEAMAALVGANV
jgi:hypothetical protein